MALTAADILDRIQRQLQDESGDRWPRDTVLLPYLSQARRWVASLRPDSFSGTTSFQLAAGAKQSVPADVRRLLGPMRHMGTDGSTPGRDIRQVDKRSKDALEPGWYAGTTSAKPREYMYDPRDPHLFWIAPPVGANDTVYVEAEVQLIPDDFDNDGEDLGMDDTYEEPLFQYVLYLAKSAETDAETGVNEARLHYRAAQQHLGLEVKTAEGGGER